MKLSKFLLTLSIATILCLCYVHQQTQIFRLAYISQKNFTLFKDLLDKNALLRYNIARDASIIGIGKKISQDTTNFQMPNTYRLVRLVSGIETRKGYLPPKTNIVLRFFAIKRQAEAKTVNP